MAVTKTEEFVGLINYETVSRQNTPFDNRKRNSYTKALENIIDIYANQARKGAYTPEEIADFEEQVSLVTVLEHRDVHLGIDRIPLYCKEVMDSITLEKQDEMVR